jgi:hypothetical protein
MAMTVSGRPVLRRLLIAAVAAGVIASLAAGAWLLFADEAHPRFDSSVRLVTEPVSCVEVAVSYGYSRDAASPGPCSGSDRALWFDLTVKNTGDQVGYLTTCSVEAFDRANRRVFEAEMKLALLGPIGGPAIDPGQTSTFRWFAHVPDPGVAAPPPMGVVAIYLVACPPTEYDGPVPV